MTCNFKTTPGMNRHQYKNLITEVLDEPTYRFGSAENSFNYSMHYFDEGPKEFSISRHGVKIYRDGQIISNCIIIGSGGSTNINQNSSLVDDDSLVVCCFGTVFSLTIPDLELKWKTPADPATCFQIIKHQADYIVYGELQVTKLDKDGSKKWVFSGVDIFVSIDNEEESKMESDGILLTDFAKTKYKIDFDGKLLWDTYKRIEKSESHRIGPEKERMWLQRLFYS